MLGGGSRIVFLGGSGPTTLFGGTGSDTFQGGSVSALMYGGLGGNNSLVGGTGLATLFGGGAADQRVATGRQAQDLVAGIGNETLSAVSSSGANSLVAGSGKDQLLGGSGADTFVGGTGASTMIGGSGKDIFAVVRSLNGGVDQVVNCTSADKIDKPGYGPHAVPSALSSQTFSNGSVTITLADNARVTFVGVSELTSKNVITGHEGSGDHTRGVTSVMAGLVPAICRGNALASMAGTSPTMTVSIRPRYSAAVCLFARRSISACTAAADWPTNSSWCVRAYS